MAEKYRRLNVVLLALALLGAVIFYGCGSSVKSDDIPALEYSISGKYLNPQYNATMNADTRASSNGSLIGVLIYSESQPTNYADVDDINHTFYLKGLKPGNHRIVFKHIPFGAGLTTYITRASKDVVLTSNNPIQELNETLVAVTAEKTVSGRLVTPSGAPATNAKVTLWGQEVQIDRMTGVFTTPVMPIGIVADLVIEESNGFQKTVTPINFSENPSYREITAVDTTYRNLPPTVSLSSNRYTCNPGDYVVFTAEASEPEGQELKYEWSVVAQENLIGSLTQDTRPNIAAWVAPNKDTLATITVTVTDVVYGGSSLSAKASVCVKVGNGRYIPNNPPVVSDITITPEDISGNRDYTLTALATDPDGDTLYYTWSFPTNSGTATRISQNSYKWRTPDIASPTSYKIGLTVTDNKENGTTNYSKTFIVNPTEVNTPPEIVEMIPAEGSVTDVKSNDEYVFSVVAEDKEKDELTFAWKAESGRIIAESSNDTAASITWKAPVLTVVTKKNIVLTVYDSRGAKTVATYTVNVVPDPDLQPPSISITSPAVDSLFKINTAVDFAAVATDTQQDKSINSQKFTWVLVSPDGSTKTIAEGNNKASFTATDHSQAGTYTARVFADDYRNITGEASIDFGINALPVASIVCNGVQVASETGRMTTPTKYTYTQSGKDYDVFQISDSVTLTSSCTDDQTPVTTLDNNSVWSFGEVTAKGKTFVPAPLASGSLNTVTLYTVDSMKEESPKVTYSFFVNNAPEFEVATSTKNGYINTDTISMNATVKDDFDGIEVTWYYKFKAKNSSEWAFDYKEFENANNPVTTTGKRLVCPTVSVSAQELIEKDGAGDYCFKLVAVDSMGAKTENEDIAFSIVDSHTLKDFIVASGTYKGDMPPYTFDDLEGKSAPYVFAAKQPFSIQSGSDRWQDDMTWTWYDIKWTNGKPGTATAINDAKVLDAYTLNGYQVTTDFGTHTIRLEGKSNSYGIVASNSVDILINSTPEVAFSQTTGTDITRFDTDGSATFTVTIKEDDKDEKLGLTWTLVELDESLNPKGTPVTFKSHDLDSGSGDIAPVSMNGANTTTVQIYWKDMVGAPALASGAWRVSVCAYDKFNAAATATLDVLVNRLPELKPVDGERLVKITVPDTSSDGEDYSYFKEVYATVATDTPVYLTSGNPSMELQFDVTAFDYEIDKMGKDINSEEFKNNIVWTYSDNEGKPMTVKGKQIKGRFGIGKNTVRVEVRDSFYGKYNNKFNSLASTTYTADFYIWHSFSSEIPDSGFTVVNMFDNGGGIFFVQLKDETGGSPANSTDLYQLDCGNVTTITKIIPSPIGSIIAVYKKEGDDYVLDGDGVRVNILGFMQRSDNGILMLTDKSYEKLSGQYGKYTDPVDKNLTEYRDYLATNTLVVPIISGNKVDYDYYESFAYEPKNFPDGNSSFPNNIVSMSFADATDNTAGVVLFKNLTANPSGAMTLYSNARLEVPSGYSPLYTFDNKKLNIVDDSKIRYLKALETVTQKLFVTDTNNDRVLRLDPSLAKANSIPVSKPIDVASTKSKYLFTLSSSGEAAINLFKIDDSSATPIATFGKFATSSDTTLQSRAGKVYNPKAIYYYTSQKNNDVFGGLLILEKGLNNKSRFQLIRSNMNDWIE